jgi:extradiol dioxygenase family protein
MAFTFNALIPELSVKDIERSRNFYCNLLGFKVEYERKEDKFCFLSFNGSQVMIEEQNNNWNTGDLEYPYGRGINFQIIADDVDALFLRLKQSGVRFYREISTKEYRTVDGNTKQTEFLIQDPDGYLLRFC